ncbi:MAG: hypothetical protein KTR31_01045 [Myxococcales bacterium]|nr:hypothetical protein [Myxococcales bacterium]
MTQERPRLRAAVGIGALVVALIVLLMTPIAPVGLYRTKYTFGFALEVPLLLAALWGLQWVGQRQATAGWLGSWRSRLVGTAWAALATYGCVRAGSAIVTFEELPLYDLVLLSKHLWVVGHDMYGSVATVGGVLAAVLPLVLWATGLLIFARLETWLQRWDLRWSARVVLPVVLVLSVVGHLLDASRWLVPKFVDSVARSWKTYEAVQGQIDARKHAVLEEIAPARSPDVHIYIVESYGEVVREDVLLEPWTAAIDDLDERLTDAGWHTASGLARAPVHGGRSWLADATMMLGITIARQAAFQHITSVIDDLPHLPKFFADRGYETVLVRPVDRARPGIRLVNHFRFEHTVFQDDLDYHGPPHPWAPPDQYTVGHAHDKVLSQLDGPTFAFFHLATAHSPWREAPVVMDHYTDWHSLGGPLPPPRTNFDFRWFRSLARLFNSRWRRTAAWVDEFTPHVYLDTVLYDMEVITRQLETGPAREQLVIIMGDHQPPFIASNRSWQVPVHVVASDPSLLDTFLGRGFEPGLRPEQDGPQMRHRDFFPVLARVLAPTEQVSARPSDDGDEPE